MPALVVAPERANVSSEKLLEGGSLAAEAQRASAVQATDDEVDLRLALRQLLQQKWLVLGVFAAVLVATAFVTLGTRKVYEASATLEYDPNPPRPLGSEVEDVSAPAGNFLAGKEWYQTQNTIIASRTVATKVVERFALHRDPEFMGVSSDQRADWHGASVDEAVDNLMDATTVRQERDTRITKVSVRNGVPDKAAMLANAVADAYMNWVMEERLGSTVRAVEWLSSQLDDISKRLDQSEHSLHEFRRENNVLSVSLADQQNGIAQTLNRFGSALTDATTKRIQVEAKLKQFEAAANADPMTVHATMLAESRAMNELRKAYYEALQDRSRLSASYGDNHPEVRRVLAQIELIREAARAEIQGIIDSLRADLREVQDVEAGLRRARQETQDKGLDLNLHEIEYNRLDRQRANNEKMHTLLLQRTTETGLTRMLRVSPVRLVDRAPVPVDPIRPRPVWNILGGCLVGLIGGVGLAFLRVRMDRSINTPEDVSAAGVTVLGLVPKIALEKVEKPGERGERRRGRRRDDGSGRQRDLIVYNNPRSSTAECCRTIRTNLAFMSPDRPLRSILVTSPGPAEGKSTIAVSLSITMASSGRKTLLIDTDLRRPRLHKVFNTPMSKGITSALAGEVEIDDCIVESMVPGLSVLPCGPIPPNPSELLHTKRFSKLLESLKERYDLLVFDSPPVGIVIDAAIIGPQLDGAVLVVESARTTRDALAQAVRQMRDVGAKLLGCVLNDVDFSKQGAYGYYYYGGEYYRAGHYYGKDSGDDAGPSASPPDEPSRATT